MEKNIEKEVHLLKMELNEKTALMRKFVLLNDRVRAAMFMKQAEDIRRKIHDYEAVLTGMDKYRNNKHLVSFIAKTVAGVVTMSDITTHYIINSQNFFADHGMTPKAHIDVAIKNAERAINELRRAYAAFVVEESVPDVMDDFMMLEETIAKKLFTDREMVYYEKYSK